MSAPPVPPLPPKPQDARPNALYPGPPPPLPPLPPSVRIQEQRYNTPSVYELDSPPHFENPLIAPRPHRVDRSIPANMARTLDDQLQINYAPGFAIPASAPPTQNWSPWSQQLQQYQQPKPNELALSFANLAMAPIPQSAPYFKPPPQQEPAIPSLTAPLPQHAQLQQAAPQIQSPTHDPALQLAWCRDVLFLVDRAVDGPAPATDPPVGPALITDPALAALAQIAVQLVLRLAASHPPGPAQGKMPPHVAEAVSMRAVLESTGAFPEFVKHNPRTAFRDFEAAARGGFAPAWFRLGRDYENFNDHAHARECFERGAKLGVESCLYRMGMAHLLGQLSLPASPATALPLLHRAALLASFTTPQPAYVYALLLLSEFTQCPPIAPSLLTPLIPPGSSPTLEARKHLERAAWLHFPAAQYKLGHAYEFAEPPFAFDPLLSVQYYALASAAGEVEADMALSKWFLCGSGGAALSGGVRADGGFDKDEALALTFADKAAKRGLPSAEFAMGYYAEVGVGQPRDVAKAVYWYNLAQSHGSTDASARLAALSQPAPLALSRSEHDALTDTNLVRRRTQAAVRAETQPVSPPWQGTVFPSLAEVREQEENGNAAPSSFGAMPAPNAFGATTQNQGLSPAAQRRRQDPRLVVDGIRKNSLMPTAGSTSPYGPAHGSGFATPLGAASQGAGGRMPAVNSPNFREQSPRRRRNDSPQRLPIGAGQQTPPHLSESSDPGQARGRRPSLARGGSNPNVNGPDSSNASLNASPVPTPPQPQSQPLTRLERMRLNLDAPGAAPSPTAAVSPSTSYPTTTAPAKGYALSDGPAIGPPRPSAQQTASGGPGAGGGGGGSGGKKAQTFAEMGIHGGKADEKECVIM